MYLINSDSEKLTISFRFNQSDFDWNSEDEDTDEPKEERGEVNGYIVVGEDDNPLSGPMQKSADPIFRSIGRLLGRVIRRSRRRRRRRRQG